MDLLDTGIGGDCCCCVASTDHHHCNNNNSHGHLQFYDEALLDDDALPPSASTSYHPDPDHHHRPSVDHPHFGFIESNEDDLGVHPQPSPGQFFASTMDELNLHHTSPFNGIEQPINEYHLHPQQQEIFAPNCSQMASIGELRPGALPHQQPSISIDPIRDYQLANSSSGLPQMIITKRYLKSRRQLTCPECMRRFNNADQFYAHFEPCWISAVEREHRRHLRLKFRQKPIHTAEEQKEELLVNVYQAGAEGEEMSFDGSTSLLRSKSGHISLFISLESKLDAKSNSLYGITHRTEMEREGPLTKTHENDVQRIMTQTPEFSKMAKKCDNEEEFDENLPSDEEMMDASGEKLERVECPVCGQRLYKHNLQVHHRIHTGELPFPCAFCPKNFRTSSARKVHHRCHTGEKPYVCPFCTYACITKRNLERHIHNRHLPVRAILQGNRRKSVRMMVNGSGHMEEEPLMMECDYIQIDE